MNFSQIFETYYTMLRGDNEIPGVGDEEWNAAIPLANAAIRAWNGVDGVLWWELWTDTATLNTGALLTVATSDGDYATPTAMAYPGGRVTLTSPEDRTVVLHVVPVENIQVMSSNADFCYFTGGPNEGWTLHIVISGAAPTSDYNGWTISYPYYRHPTFFASDEDGTTKPEIADPMFIVHSMLAAKARPSRNSLLYQTADRDAQEVLKSLQHRNDMQTPHDTWQVDDTEGAGFGI